jgi:hypothetical protein
VILRDAYLIAHDVLVVVGVTGNPVFFQVEVNDVNEVARSDLGYNGNCSLL